jgi:hypothetical protein
LLGLWNKMKGEFHMTLDDYYPIVSLIQSPFSPNSHPAPHERGLFLSPYTLCARNCAVIMFHSKCFYVHVYSAAIVSPRIYRPVIKVFC